jgi:polyisoprenyl-phosphate glycosyltransferase
MVQMNTTLKKRQHLLSQQRLHISFVVPVLNESENISLFIEQLCEYIKHFSHHIEIVVIDDGSDDNTFMQLHAAAQQYPVKALQFSRHFGKEKAIAAGLLHATGDVCIIIDADFQHPFSTIETFLKKWSEGYDMVYGQRSNRQDETWLKRSFTHLFYKALNLTSKIKIPPDAGDFRLLDRCAINALNQCREGTRFMKGLYAWVGYKQCAVSFEVQKRHAGKSRWKLRKLTELAVTGFISFSDVPLRAWGLIGLLIAGISFMTALYIIFRALIDGVITPGYTSMIVTVIFFGGIQLLSIGILGEYIARIFHEVKRRPAFIIAKTINIDSNEQESHAHEPVLNIDA